MRLLPWTYAVRNLGRSTLRTALQVSSGMLVVLLVLSATAFVRGMDSSLARSGEPANVILMSAGSEESLERSEIELGTAGIAAASIDGLKERLGSRYLSPEIHMATTMFTSPDATHGHPAMMRGMTPGAFLVHSAVRITAGKAPVENELLVGRFCHARMSLPHEQLAIGKQLWLDGRAWKISGHFEAPGTVMEAELWAPLDALRIATRRADNISCVVLTLDSAELADVELFCKQRLDLELVAMREVDYYAKIAAFYAPVKGMVWVTAVLVALGGLFGGLNTMYAAFAARVRELAALQALGFSRVAIVVSLLQESLLASAAGALVAAAVGLAFIDGIAVRFSMGAFGLTVDPQALTTGLGAGLLLGLVGALPPAWRCLRLPIAIALKHE